MSVNNSLYTVHTMMIGATDYDVIKNFCTDHKIENVPDRRNMFIELLTLVGYHNPMKSDMETTYLMDDIEIVEHEKFEGSGTVLSIMGNSPAIAQLVIDSENAINSDEVEVISSIDGDEIFLGVVLCSDYEGNLNLEDLSLKLRSYLNDDRLAFSEIKTRYLSEDEYINIQDGVEGEA